MQPASSTDNLGPRRPEHGLLRLPKGLHPDLTQYPLRLCDPYTHPFLEQRHHRGVPLGQPRVLVVEVRRPGWMSITVWTTGYRRVGDVADLGPGGCGNPCVPVLRLDLVEDQLRDRGIG